ncbi:hypothetical protein [Burkholderia aenigmatica]|uniref:hypothetical protein n=1 Tax=Burkholderia aenigmatica TaxID=2015348 RepID=UPI002655FF34|nr:hypothetical protein [Burkholderia aenigmatica]MDN7877997.1 hypothetical protein [Burkholderia aenigmatica]
MKHDAGQTDRSQYDGMLAGIGDKHGSLDSDGYEGANSRETTQVRQAILQAGLSWINGMRFHTE